MEAIALDRSISINKQMKNNNNLKKKIQTPPHYYQQQHLHTNNMMIDHNFIKSQPLSNKDIDMMLMKINMMHGHHNNYHGPMHGGVFLNPHANNYPLFYRSTSLPPPPPPPHHHHHPPPLLPLPATTKPSFSSLPPPIRRRSSLSPPSIKKPSKKQQHLGKKCTKVNDGDAEESNKRVGPDPDEIFSLSPPPSSLPLPRFSLRQPKRSCTVEASVVDDGVHAGVVADNLSRILRIR